MRNMREGEPGHRRALPAYIGAGGIATASHYAVTVVAVEALGWVPVAASFAGFAVGAAIKYWLNRTVAFRSRARHAIAMRRFAIALAALMALNTLLFALLQRGLGLHYLVAQVLTTAALIPPGYLVHRHWVFRAC